MSIIRRIEKYPAITERSVSIRAKQLKELGMMQEKKD
jgi:hypothetical protein